VGHFAVLVGISVAAFLQQRATLIGWALLDYSRGAHRYSLPSVDL
jgi:hypothetical protein